MCKKDGKFKATALSAEITFGSWGRALWVTAANAAYENGKDDKDNTKYYETIVTDVHQSWGGAAPRTGLAIAGNSDNVGFKLDIHSNATGICQGGNAYIWVKPIDSLRVSVGKHDDNFLRSDAAYGLWNWDRLGCVDGVGEGFIFDNYLDKTTGVNAHFTPNEALSVGFHLPLDLEGNHSASTVTKDNGEKESDPYVTGALADAWLNSAIVFGYKIEGVGTAKAGLKLNTGVSETSEKAEAEKILGKDTVADLVKAGKKFDETKYNGYARDKDGKDVKTWVEIAAAFELTSVENLYASLGVKVPTLNTQPYQANVYAKYNANEQLAIHAIVGTKINNLDKKKTADEDEWKTGFGFLAGAGVEYALDGGISLFADVRYANNIYKSNTSADKADCLTLGAGVTKGFSNGLMGVAFEGATNSNGRYGYKDGEQFAWEIPVKFEYCF